jgi:hypothetical protein
MRAVVSKENLFALLVLVSVLGFTAEKGFCRTIGVRADGSGDYPTIQAAIDTAVDGDEVVLERGIYAGEGNRNLDFQGKAITVRSLLPDDNKCMRETVINAQGRGVIARFVKDEGTGTVFEGFTLGAGDTSKDLRGDPGFFEFSANARPTTRRLRNLPASIKAGKADTTDVYDPEFPGWVPPIPGRVWSGHNPYHQPANTTYYYGSGDVNNDGQLTSADVAIAQDMADFELPWRIQADVDGDTDVDSTDVAMISAALSGGTLESWWNSLTTREQRNNWITKAMQIEKTNEHTYYLNYFVCHHFAIQTFTHFNYLRADFALESTEFDGGQTVFNLPTYFVSVGMPTNHAINAILVGDDPNEFDDWRFLEPQNDTTVAPGGWNMRYGSSVTVSSRVGHGNAEVMIAYQVEETGITTTRTSENLLTTRPVPVQRTVDNEPDLWNPRIIRVANTGAMLFEKMRDDQSRTTAIHMGELPFMDPSAAGSVFSTSHFTRLMDTTEGPDGVIHLLWEGKASDDRQNMFHSEFDPIECNVKNVTQITEGLRLAATARIVVTPDNEIHAFWFENSGYSGAYDFGIHWSKWMGSSWASPQKLTTDTPQAQNADWLNRHIARYIFDCVALDSGDIILVWNEKVFPTHYLAQMVYDGATWSSSRIEDTGWYDSLRGLDLCKDSNGLVHLAYWTGDRQQPCGLEEGRGDIYHRFYDGLTWSSGVVIDDAGTTACPRIAAASGAKLYMIWERKVADRVIPVWSENTGGTWKTPEIIDARADANVWYPTITALRDGKVLAAWSSKSNDLVTIETKLLKTNSGNPNEQYYPLSYTGDFNCDTNVDLMDYAMLASSFNSTSADSNWDGIIDISVPSDDIIDDRDLALLLSNWLTEPPLPPQETYDGFEEGNFTEDMWNQSGDADWQVVSGVSRSGDYSARSGDITHDMSTVLTISSAEGARISFFRKISSESNFDHLYFYVDGQQKGKWSGEEDWTYETFFVEPGAHTISWSYKKDGSVSSGSDCAWIDDVRITP